MSYKVVHHSQQSSTPYLLVDDQEIVKPVYSFLNLLYARGLSKRTIRAYAYGLLTFYRFLKDSDLKIEALRYRHFTDFILYQRREGAAPRTINQRIDVVRHFLNVSYDRLGDRLTAPVMLSPFYKGKRNRALIGKIRIQRKGKKSFKVKVPSLIITPLTPEEIKSFLSGIKSYRNIAMTYLMIFCGLRSCEVLALTIDDIDFARGQIRVHGKGGKERILPLTNSVRTAVTCYLDYERPQTTHNKCFTVLQGNRRGQPLSEDGLRRFFRYRRQVTHLNKTHPHLLRHTFCTSLINQHVPLPVVQKLMGHTDIEITMDYVHMSIDDITREYEKAVSSLEKRYETTKT